MVLGVVALHLLGGGLLLWSVATLHLAPGIKSFGLAVGLTAYVLGARHAFDADHIAAIDNTTRHLVSQGRRSLTVGFWFSLGHSTIVFALTLLIALGARAAAAHLASETSSWRAFASTFGTLISGGYLLLIAALHLFVLKDLWRAIRRVRADGGALDNDHRHGSGVLFRLLGPFAQSITRPWRMYLVGLLFGLGFDTATEVSLLALSGSGAASGVPWYAVLSLPLLFAAGMSLFDGLDGILVNAVYGWAGTKGGSRLRYNTIVSLASVTAAVGIGGLELVGLISDQLRLDGPFWTAVAHIDLTWAGVGLTLLLGAALAVAFWSRRPAPKEVVLR